jgi:hypothetical protein
MNDIKNEIVAALARNSESSSGGPDNVPLPEFIRRWLAETTDGEPEVGDGWDVVRHMPEMLPPGDWLVLGTGIGHDCIDEDHWPAAYCLPDEFLLETPDTVIATYTPEGWKGTGYPEGVAALTLHRAKHLDFIAFVDRYTDDWTVVTWLYLA